VSEPERLAMEMQPVFDRTVQLLRSKGSEILDMSLDEQYIETKNAFYSIIEGRTWEITRIYPQFSNAVLLGKNFAIHAPRLAYETILEIESMGFVMIARDTFHKMASIATTEIQIGRNVDDYEATQ